MNGINAGDTAFVLISTALVCMMTPALAIFYGGLVRQRDVLSIMIQNFICMGVIGLIWVFGGFSLAFGPSGRLLELGRGREPEGLGPVVVFPRQDLADVEADGTHRRLPMDAETRGSPQRQIIDDLGVDQA